MRLAAAPLCLHLAANRDAASQDGTPDDPNDCDTPCCNHERTVQADWHSGPYATMVRQRRLHGGCARVVIHACCMLRARRFMLHQISPSRYKEHVPLLS